MANVGSYQKGWADGLQPCTECRRRMFLPLSQGMWWTNQRAQIALAQTLLPGDWGCFTDCKTQWLGNKDEVVISFFLGRNSRNLVNTEFPVEPAWEERSWRSGSGCRGVLASCRTWVLVPLPLQSHETNAPNSACALYSRLPQGWRRSATQTVAETSAVSISFSR